MARAPASLKALFGELGDLKRVRSTGREGSVAARLFRAAWGELILGKEPRSVAVAITAAALAAARLGDIDGGILAAAKLPPAAIGGVLRRGVAELTEAVAEPLRAELIAAAAQGGSGPPVALPPFVANLEAQPRAGVTCPGKPRILLQPPESHAEHCLIVAVYGVLLSPRYEADIATVFLAGLSHHFHNAGMPDAGFTGEMLLGPHLETVMDHFTTEALASLAPRLREAVERARNILPDADTAEGRAFHAADVVDRVVEIAQHLRAASLTMGTVLGDMALVHDGPVKPFHDRVLREMGLP